MQLHKLNISPIPSSTWGVGRELGVCLKSLASGGLMVEVKRTVYWGEFIGDKSSLSKKEVSEYLSLPP